MTLIIHIIIAIASIGLASYAYFRPSANTLKGAYVSAGLTLASGFYLVWTTPSHMLQACMSGVAYLAVVTVAIMAARAKLAQSTLKQHN